MGELKNPVHINIMDKVTVALQHVNSRSFCSQAEIARLSLLLCAYAYIDCGFYLNCIILTIAPICRHNSSTSKVSCAYAIESISTPPVILGRVR